MIVCVACCRRFLLFLRVCSSVGLLWTSSPVIFNVVEVICFSPPNEIGDNLCSRPIACMSFTLACVLRLYPMRRFVF